jgi:hypothetical protein
MSKKSEDRSSLCVFTFADGRHCTLPQSPDDMGLCYYHARRLVNKQRAQKAGQQIARLLDTQIATAGDLSAAFNALFAATAQGYIKPKTATALGYIGHLMLQTQQLAKEEFVDTFQTVSWGDIVYESPAVNTYHPLPNSRPEDESDESACRRGSLDPQESPVHKHTFQPKHTDPTIDESSDIPEEPSNDHEPEHQSQIPELAAAANSASAGPSYSASSIARRSARHRSRR